MVKNLPATWETCVWSLGWDDPLEKGMATHSSVLAWKIPWTEEPGRLSPWGRKELDTTERLHFTSLSPSFSLSCSGSFHKPLIILHQRADKQKTTITEN